VDGGGRLLDISGSLPARGETDHTGGPTRIKEGGPPSTGLIWPHFALVGSGVVGVGGERGEGILARNGGRSNI